MNEMTGDAWKRLGSSIVWEKTLVLPLVEHERPHPLRDVLIWHRTNSFPSVPVRKPFVVTGLQTCLELLPSPIEAHTFLTRFIQPLVRFWQNEFSESGLIFTMHCTGNQWNLDKDGYPELKLSSHRILPVGNGVWNGAADQAMKILFNPQLQSQTPKKSAKTAAIEPFGGLYVRRLS